MPVLLRPLDNSDLPEIGRIERECFSDPWSFAILSALLTSEWDETWLIETPTGHAAGYANFRFLAGEGELMRIAVLPEYRGRGYARKLMERLDISAARHGAADLTLEVRAGNEAALKLYESCGFKTEAVRRGYYSNPTEDAKIMWRRQA